QEKSSLFLAPEHAGETASVKVDCLQHLTTLADAHAALIRNVCVPDGVVGVQANPVGNAAPQVSPYPPIGQAAVGNDLEGGELLAVGLGDDQRCVVGRHGHPIRKSEAIGYLSNRVLGRNQGDDSGSAIDIGAAATVHDDFVPDIVRKAAQMGIG